MSEKRKAVCPGSFDPPTNGHLDVLHRACKIFDSVIVAVVENPSKAPFFSTQERVEMLKETLADEGLSFVEVGSFNGLLVDYMKKMNASVIIRGLRALSDFEYEFQMALMNRKLSPGVETVFFMTDEKYAYLSSSIVKEIFLKGADVSHLVPEAALRKFKSVARSL